MVQCGCDCDVMFPCDMCCSVVVLCVLIVYVVCRTALDFIDVIDAVGDVVCCSVKCFDD